ncbi:MAG: asparagine synthase (glutamine-hydrolyzing) [Elusimicrobiales bacterium]|nr:asparagine synthase (glutamine-hydrolyzing) [Elusimicrobiales bacterium]
MCGIAGVLSLGRPLSPSDKVMAGGMTEVLRHRGPDSIRVLGDEKAAVGCARLRITDLSPAADLPMVSEDGSLWLAYNGAVTNFRELDRRFSLSAERPLRTASDAEVVLRLYERMGIGALEELSGQFAFCLVDRRLRKAFIVRDPYGIRPVFWTEYGGRLYFASEIKGLLQVPGWDRTLDTAALWHYFSLAYIPGDATPYLGARELSGGMLIEADLDKGRFSERRYYSPDFTPDHGLTERGAAEEVRRLMKGAVERSLDTDAPAGLTLSGGVDTSVMLALAKESGKAAGLHTFSIRMAEPSFDETPYQRLMAEYAGTAHHEVKVGPEEVLGCLLSTAAHLDEPTGDGAAAPSFLLAREASRHVKVLLSGEGGDEIFSAYETHRACRARAAWRRWVPAPARAAARFLAGRLPVSNSKLSFDFLAKRFTQGAELGVPEAHCFWRHSAGEDEKRRLLRVPPPSPDTPGLFREIYDSLPYEDDLSRLAAIDLRHYFIDDLMVKNDRPFMAASVETRFPYMERDIASFALRIPPSFKVRGLAGRRIQKLAFRDIVPARVLNRSNMGLEMPHSLWFFGGFRALAEKYLSRDMVEGTGLLRYEEVRRLWEEHMGRRRDNGRTLWCILNFVIWFDLFVREGDYRKHLSAPAGRGG